MSRYIWSHTIVVCAFSLILLLWASGPVAAQEPGSVWAWGRNSESQLGDGTTWWRSTPVAVVDPADPSGYLTHVVGVAGGEYHTVALKADGTVRAWGLNAYGRLGDGTQVQRHTPVQVVGPGGVGVLTDIVAVAAGYTHSVAVRSDKTVWAWGGNSRGQLGDGTLDDRHTPVRVKGLGGLGALTDIVAVAAGHYHTVALVGPLGGPPVAVALVNGQESVILDEESWVGTTVTLDATESSDPDNDELAYAWDFTSDGTVDSTDAVVQATYALGGPYTATLTVTDPAGESSTDTVSITVLAGSAGNQLANLRAFIVGRVASGHIEPELEQPLVTKVDSAIDALARDNPNAAKVAMNDLKALVNQVEAQVGHKIDAATAAEIIQRANAIIAALGG